ncbi:MAG TPA: YtpI family protein [Candidatus Avamphibacillus intestinigallinarum]|nr:YtpI family protein [Candidatus Avamphibacillus intestinigallinarum]
MFIFSVIMIVTLVLYVYYKVQIIKEKERLLQVYINAKSRICLGTFVLLFGLNQYILYQSKLSLYIMLVFILLGGAQAVRGFKEAKHYRKEWKRIHAES